MENEKNAKYNEAYSRPLVEAQKAVVKSLYVPFALRDKIKTDEKEPSFQQEDLQPVEE